MAAGKENQRLNDQAVDDIRNRGGVLEHPEDRVADFLLGMKTDAQFLHPRVEIDAEQIADALQNPNRVAEEKSDSDQADHRYDAADDACVNQYDAPIGMQRHTEHPRFSGFQCAAVTDYVEENAHQRESDQTAEKSRQRQPGTGIRDGAGRDG